MFRGDKINISEKRAVLHVALRAPRGASIVVDGQNVVPEVHAVLDKMADFADRVRSGAWKGHTGKRIRNVDQHRHRRLRPRPGDGLRSAQALQRARHDLPLRLQRRRHRLRRGGARPRSRRDAVHHLLQDLHHARDDDQRAHRARLAAGRARTARQAAMAKHFVAVSTNAQEVAKFGIDTANMFGFWDWVGGRYSMDSAIGLSTMLAIGPDNFRAMLGGFHEMDEHFRTAPFERNLPVLMGLLAVWYTNFFGAQTVARAALRAVSEALSRLSPAAHDGEQRQARDLDGARVDYDTGPIYWGEPGTNGQHSFYQLIHQGTRLIPCDFIAFAQTLNPLGRHHDMLLANVFAQAEALAFGKTAEAGQGRRHARLAGAASACSRATGRRTRILLDDLTPAALGKLVALYEHSVFTQGVDLEHRFLRPVGRRARQGAGPAHHPRARGRRRTPTLEHDSSTNALIRALSQASKQAQRSRRRLTHAARNDRPWPDGREHGAPPDQGRPRMRGVRHVAEGGGRAGRRRRPSAPPRSPSSSRSSTKPRAVWLMVPAGVVDKTHRRSAAAARGRRHPDRRRQLVLRRRHPPREGAGAEGHPLCRRRHQRRRLGPRARLLHDDRRRDRRR